ncbi:DUF742 domain-containing protein [Streptomyces olivoverticillatus]
MTPPAPRHERGLVRPYVVTDGRSHPTRNTFDLVTLVMAHGDRPLGGLSPEKRRLMELCLGGALSVAEIAQPPDAARQRRQGTARRSRRQRPPHHPRPPIPSAELPEAQILQEVLDGLRARL